MTMAHTSPSTSPGSPTLFATTSGTSRLCTDLIDAVAELAAKGDGASVPLQQLCQACDACFLFEVPAVLLDEGAVQACAVLLPRNGGSKVCFVVLDVPAGSIKVLDFEDVPERACRFFRSYSAVLSCLNTLGIAARAH